MRCPPAGGTATLLTPGEGEVESAELTLDRKRIVYTTNIGDSGRRHLFSVDFGAGVPVALTGGRESQWAPTPLADGEPRLHQRGPGNAALAVTVRAADGPQRAGAAAGRAGVVPRRAHGRARTGAVHGDRRPARLRPAVRAEEPQGLRVDLPARRPAPGDAAGLPLLRHVLEPVRAQPVPGEPRLRRALRRLSRRHYAPYSFRNAPNTGTTQASEYRDILGGVEFLKRRADVDPERIGTHGLSWGGYLVALGLARNSDIFKVGFDMAGMHAGPIAAIDTWKFPGDARAGRRRPQRQLQPGDEPPSAS